jgi:outer membrane receptor protein involved in Fe transport
LDLTLGALLAAAVATSTPTPPPAFTEDVTVIATGFDLSMTDSPGSVAVVGSTALDLAPSPALDDTLRQVPGFTLFRRSGSRTANPTTHGVSLRGVGGSGSGRTAVLWDGVPLTDPFGGWAYWSRVPRAAVDHVEILRGGGSDLYGSGGLGGVVRLFRREGEGAAARLEASMGSQGTPEVSGYGRAQSRGWGFSASGEYFRTDGYVLVDTAERGAVDTPAGSRHGTGEVGVSRRLGTRGRVFIRGSLFDEDRKNGTPEQVNDTALRQASAGGEWALGAGQVSLRAYTIDQDYHQTFSAIAADRASERLNRTQDVAARGTGGSVESRWSAGRHQLAAGLEVRTVSGENDEVAIAATNTPSRVVGRQRTGGIFVEDRLGLGSRASLTLGLRGDTWKNHDARRTTGSAAPVELASRSESALSPRAALVFSPAARWTLVGSGYRGFRAPTLNELYRSFRVGNVLTQGNEALEAERLTGFDAGVRVQASSRVLARVTAFHMTVDDPVANVTVSSTPALIERQRRNLGRTRSRGIEADVEWRPLRVVSLRAGYLFVDARVRSFAADPSLEGRFVPQVARHAGSVQLRADGRVGRAWIQARWNGEQWDDDQNQLRLAPFVTFDARVERRLVRGLAAFAAVENLGGTRYDIGRTPTRTIGPPRSFRLGIVFDKR